MQQRDHAHILSWTKFFFTTCYISHSFPISCWPTEELLIITSEGASGDYPGCTDLAYTKAASDGADVLNCPVQMTKDGIPFCLGSIDLMDKTTVSRSTFTNIANNVPELNITNGIVTFNLTWDEIKSLKRKFNLLVNCHLCCLHVNDVDNIFGYWSVN